MANKFMYFGTKERMAWVPCPAINAGISTTRWSATSEYLNGGAAARSSTTSHGDYTFSWAPSSQDDAYATLDYFDGLYGPAPYYFLSPFAMETNVLPAWLAAPRLGAEDAPTLVEDKRPTTTTTPTNTLGYPTRGATQTLSASDVFRTFDFPVPPGYTFHLGVKGAVSGTAALTLNGSAVTPGNVTSMVRFTHSTTDPWASISASGVGVLTLYAMMAVVLPTGVAPPTGGFVSGRGNSGVSIKSDPVRTGYSAALDSVGTTVALIETGGWK